MKKQNKSSIVWFILSVIAMIFLTMRVAMNWELKGAVLVFFILGIVIEIIWIAKNIIKFFRENKKPPDFRVPKINGPSSNWISPFIFYFSRFANCSAICGISRSNL